MPDTKEALEMARRLKAPEDFISEVVDQFHWLETAGVVERKNNIISLAGRLGGSNT